MDPGGISVGRILPIDGALLDDVLLRLRRDSPASALRWTLGDLGAAEVDVCFMSAGPAWTANARLWNRTGLAVAAATLRIEATGPDAVHVTLECTLPPAPVWGPQSRDLSDLARAAIDELGEELLWHATRAGLTPSG
jgi:hypothetical protein